MLVRYIRSLTSPTRTASANRHLGVTLAFVAGATNAGGFLAVHQYTSHMSGIVSLIADDLVVGNVVFVLAGLGSLAAFIGGAACTAIIVNYGRRHRLQSVYAAPLMLEATLLLCFGSLGSRLPNIEALSIPTTVLMLCFLMGLQNAVITKISHAEIRTTHVTGMVTDIGIELGKLFYLNRAAHDGPPVRGDRARLAILTITVTSFLVGGVVGAAGFSHIGFVAAVPLAALLAVVAGASFFDDAASFLRGRTD